MRACGGYVEFKQIKELMAAMERAGMKKIIIKEKSGDEVHLERQEEHSPHLAPVYPPAFHPAPVEMVSRPQPTLPSHAHPPAEEKKGASEGSYVTSPMVGTFYSAAGPDDPPFVKVGDRIEAGTVICIIEAMKVMNEVKAGLSGVVAEILVQNAHPVEFGTKILRIT